MKLTLVLAVIFAALLAPTIATAAELPSRQAQPAPSAQKCRIDGQEGIVLPGSGTCLRVSGYVNAQAGFGTVSGSRKIGAP